MRRRHENNGGQKGDGKVEDCTRDMRRLVKEIEEVAGKTREMCEKEKGTREIHHQSSRGDQ